MKEKFKKIQEKEKRVMTECEYCGKQIVRNTWNKKYRLINICQQPPKRFFCSHQCKLEWIFKMERIALT
jgi:ssDNA-binding Zn-finger/Zn-ribbon topoisomerase 1